MPRYKRVKTNHQEPRDNTSTTHLCRGRRWEVMGRLAQRGEPQKANRYPLKACRPCKKSGRGWAGSGYFQNGWGPGARVRPTGLGRVKRRDFKPDPLLLSPGQSPLQRNLLALESQLSRKGKLALRKEKIQIKVVEENRQNVSERKLPYFWTLHKNNRRGATVKSEKLPWTSF